MQGEAADANTEGAPALRLAKSTDKPTSPSLRNTEGAAAFSQLKSTDKPTGSSVANTEGAAAFRLLKSARQTYRPSVANTEGAAAFRLLKSIDRVPGSSGPETPDLPSYPSPPGHRPSATLRRKRKQRSCGRRIAVLSLRVYFGFGVGACSLVGGTIPLSRM